jgi:hypothetical protein
MKFFQDLCNSPQNGPTVWRTEWPSIFPQYCRKRIESETKRRDIEKDTAGVEVQKSCIEVPEVGVQKTCIEVPE